MKFIEFFGIELVALGLFSWWFLVWLRSHKKKLERSYETARFVGGPLDGQERKVRALKPAIFERVGEYEYAQYDHDSYGVYTFERYIHE